MAILPSFYNQVDQDIYTGGEHYIPQENYRLGYTAPPSIANASTGITNTNVAKPYIWPPQGGGEGGGGPGSNNKFGLDLSTQKTIDSGRYVEKGGPGNMYGGNYVKDSRDIAKTEGGIWKDVDTGQNVYHGNLNVKTPMTMIIDKLTGKKTTGDPYKGTWYGSDWSDKDEEKGLYSKTLGPKNFIQRWKIKRDFKRAEAERVAQEKAQAKLDADYAAARPALQAQSEANRAANTGGWQSGMANDEAFMTGPAEGEQLSDTMASFAQGGRIGYNRGRVVNPGGYQGEEEENEFSIFSPKTWFPGGPESETNPTLFGTQNSLLNKASIAQLKNAIGIYQASGKLNQEQQLDYELKLKQLEALIAGSKGQAEGGLIGYFDGGIAGLL